MVQKSDNIDSEIVLLLLKGACHLREIARQLKASHSTAMRRLNGLVNGNVLDCRTEGKNRVFSIKKSLQARSHVYNAERYKLLKVVDRYPEMGIIVDDILKKSREKLIVLFGSYAKLEATGSSDIDIYVENGKGAKDIGDIHSRISVKSGRFDPESRLIREIIKNHVILRGVEEFYEKTGFFE